MSEYRDQAQDKDWERISELLREADCVPDAPDCRTAVMARIARPKPARRFVWAYAGGFAALIVAGVVIAPLLTSNRQVDRIAYRPKTGMAAPAPSANPETKMFAQIPNENRQPEPLRREKHLFLAKRVRIAKPVMMASANDAEVRAIGDKLDRAAPVIDNGSMNKSWYDRSRVSVGHAAPSSTSAGREVAVPAKSNVNLGYFASGTRDFSKAAAAPAAKPARAIGRSLDATVAAAPAAPADTNGALSTYKLYDDKLDVARRSRAVGGTMDLDDAVDAARPVAVAMATWPSASNQNQDSSDYSYVTRDPATGSTTECRVKRSGNTVEIYLESKPAAPQPPVKGSLDHETVPNA